MSKVQELEVELQKAKAKEKEVLKQNLINENKSYIGRCFSTHTFKRKPTSGKSMALSKVIGIKFNENDFKVHYELIIITFYFHPYNHTFNFSSNESSFSDRPYPHWIGSFNHTISEKLFNKVYEEVIAHSETYFDKISGLFKQDEDINQGEYSKDRSSYNLLSKHYEFIDLPITGYQSIRDILAWNNHPFIFNENKLLNTRASIEMIKDIADKMLENAQRWGGSILDRDLPRVKLLTDFYKKNQNF